jgi:hypothetical protein
VINLTYLSSGVTDMDDQCPNCAGTNFVSKRKPWSFVRHFDGRGLSHQL